MVIWGPPDGPVCYAELESRRQFRENLPAFRGGSRGLPGNWLHRRAFYEFNAACRERQSDPISYDPDGDLGANVSSRVVCPHGVSCVVRYQERYPLEFPVCSIEAQSKWEVRGVDPEAPNFAPTEARDDADQGVTGYDVGAIAVDDCHNGLIDLELEVYPSGRTLATDPKLECLGSKIDLRGPIDCPVALAEV